ncbi:transcription elongation factor Elf1 like-domain-containing protein [Chaetomium tenue]|uniref:Transcription elongation factor Elf1 like-domain-containing protein n=1 Tax=Chaetomium tenue TaxID=1854479 RepID=A0ACB7PLF0_9PEZI|nr:transcription elongation factor Elf1 like-domain-containing protein [Chaetomium globosum]
MGKRKSSSKPQGPKKRDPLPTTFTCLFCNHEKSVEVKLDKKAGCGRLECKICGQRFQCGINYLSSPIDVYSEWVDAADAVAAEASEAEKSREANGSGSKRTADSSLRIDENEDLDSYAGEGIVDDEEYD